MTTFNACWPVTDDTATLRQLIEEATPELHRMVAGIAHEMVSEPSWTTTDAGGLSLLASVEVEPAATPKARTAADTIEDIEWLLEADPALLPANVEQRLGRKWGNVATTLRRAGRSDLAERITANHDRRNHHLTGRRVA